MTNYQKCHKCGRDDISLETPEPCNFCPFCGNPISEESILNDLKKNYKSMRVDDLK